MAYADLVLLSIDQDFLTRCAAAYSTQPGVQPDAYQWAAERKWALAASPGFSDAYASALAGGVDRPGWDAAVITDPQILSAVQVVLTEGVMS